MELLRIGVVQDVNMLCLYVRGRCLEEVNVDVWRIYKQTSTGAFLRAEAGIVMSDSHVVL